MSEIAWGELIENAGDAAPDDLPPGVYEATVKVANYRQTSKGDPGYGVLFATEDGRTSWWNAYAVRSSSTNLGIFFRDMAALGLTTDFFRADPSGEQVADALVGQRARITVATKKGSNGYPDRVQVTKIQALDGVERLAAVGATAPRAPF